MNKTEFLKALKHRLSWLPHEEREERVAFVGETIADRMEEGLSEEDAVLAVGSLNEIAAQITKDKGESFVLKKQSKHKLSLWEWGLLILGAPLWIVLLSAGLVIMLALNIVVWAVAVSLWITELPFYILMWISKGLIYVCKWVTYGAVWFSKGSIGSLKKFFTR